MAPRSRHKSLCLRKQRGMLETCQSIAWEPNIQTMNDDVVTDLKQFIATTVSQVIAPLRDDIKRLDEKIDKVDKKLDNAVEGIGDAIDNLPHHVESRLDNHEVRITKLESPAASVRST